MRGAVFLVAALSLAACYRGTPDVSQNSPSEATTVAGGEASKTNTITPPLPQELDNPTNRAKAALPAHEVQLVEYAIRMPDTIPAGRLAFDVQNAGKEDHGFEIEGNGVHQSTQILKRGNSTALEVDLKPGTYTVYCPVKGHKERGMSRTVTVH